MPIKAIYQRLKNTWIGKATVSVPLIITIIFAALTVKNLPSIDERIETEFVDYRFKIRNFFLPPPVPDNIMIVAIDDRTFEKFGRWPLSRKIQAELINKIFKGNPKVVVVDIIHPQSESPEADRALAEVFSKYSERLVVGLEFKVEEGKKFKGEIEDVLYDYAISSYENNSYLQNHSVEAYEVILPPEPIASSSPFGHVNYLPDRDGILRWELLYIKYGEEYFPSLALQAARIAMGLEHDKIKIVGGAGVDLGKLFIKTDEFGRFHINWLGRARTINYESAGDVLLNRVSSEVFRDKIVLVGTTAAAGYDQKVSPFSADVPGVEKNATVVANIINENFIERAPTYFDIIVVLLVGISALVISQRQNALSTFVVYTFLVVVFFISNQLLFSYSGIRINFIYPTFTLLTSGTFIISYRYFVEERSARDIKRVFSSYVTERIVNELIKNPSMARLGGERREITILFSDIRGFTTFSEKRRDNPEEVVTILNEYLSAMTEVIFKWEGTLDKFVGDEILAFWGAPMRQDDHAERTLRCALDMARRLGELNEKWKSEGKPTLNAGIGINTGDMVVGNIGAEGKKMDYTVIGDNVNLGARVEGLTKKFDSHILITEYTLNKVRDNIKHSNIGHLYVHGKGQVIVKGKELPIYIYEVKSIEPGAESKIIESEEDEIVRLREK